MRLDERLLDNVLGLGMIAYHQVGNPQCHRLVISYQFGKRVDVSPGRLRDEVIFGQWTVLQFSGPLWLVHRSAMKVPLSGNLSVSKGVSVENSPHKEKEMHKGQPEPEPPTTPPTTRWALVVVLALVVSACGAPIAEIGVQAQTQTSATGPNSSTMEKADRYDCPITIPNGFHPAVSKKVIYTEDLPAPDPFPMPPEGMEWHGDDDLWTALPLAGEIQERKSVWWSANFPGGTVEERPEVHVTWSQLDGERVVDNGREATNAYTAEEGWFMIAGIDPDDTGCWEVTAMYKGASLSYIYHHP